MTTRRAQLRTASGRSGLPLLPTWLDLVMAPWHVAARAWTNLASAMGGVAGWGGHADRLQKHFREDTRRHITFKSPSFRAAGHGSSFMHAFSKFPPSTVAASDCQHSQKDKTRPFDGRIAEAYAILVHHQQEASKPLVELYDNAADYARMRTIYSPLCLTVHAMHVRMHGPASPTLVFASAIVPEAVVRAARQNDSQMVQLNEESAEEGHQDVAPLHRRFHRARDAARGILLAWRHLFYGPHAMDSAAWRLAEASINRHGGLGAGGVGVHPPATLHANEMPTSADLSARSAFIMTEAALSFAHMPSVMGHGVTPAVSTVHSLATVAAAGAGVAAAPNNTVDYAQGDAEVYLSRNAAALVLVESKGQRLLVGAAGGGASTQIRSVSMLMPSSAIRNIYIHRPDLAPGLPEPSASAKCAMCVAAGRSNAKAWMKEGRLLQAPDLAACCHVCGKFMHTATACRNLRQKPQCRCAVATGAGVLAGGGGGGGEEEDGGEGGEDAGEGGGGGGDGSDDDDGAGHAAVGLPQRGCLTENVRRPAHKTARVEHIQLSSAAELRAAGGFSGARRLMCSRACTTAAAWTFTVDFDPRQIRFTENYCEQLEDAGGAFGAGGGVGGGAAGAARWGKMKVRAVTTAQMEERDGAAAVGAGAGVAAAAAAAPYARERRVASARRLTMTVSSRDAEALTESLRRLVGEAGAVIDWELAAPPPLPVLQAAGDMPAAAAAPAWVPAAPPTQLTPVGEAGGMAFCTLQDVKGLRARFDRFKARDEVVRARGALAPPQPPPPLSAPSFSSADQAGWLMMCPCCGHLVGPVPAHDYVFAFKPPVAAGGAWTAAPHVTAATGWACPGTPEAAAATAGAVAAGDAVLAASSAAAQAGPCAAVRAALRTPRALVPQDNPLPEDDIPQEAHPDHDVDGAEQEPEAVMADLDGVEEMDALDEAADEGD